MAATPAGTGSGGLGTGRSVWGGILRTPPNARVVLAAFLRSGMVRVPLASAQDTHRRPAASYARRQTGRQKCCVLPPVVRGSKLLPHLRQVVAVEFSGIGRTTADPFNCNQRG